MKNHYQKIMSTKFNSIAYFSPNHQLKACSTHKKAGYRAKHHRSTWKTGAFMADYHYSACVASQHEKSQNAWRNEINTAFVRFWLRIAACSG
ncbi:MULTISPECIES: hypothetical protein [unclassified Aeromonas]|uniref:hypothetical protein n=1 Tax=unclassified Aeromonas TaxID=257493 RepID=UPI003528DB9C